MDLTTAVKMNIYETIAETTRPPDVAQSATTMSLPASDVQRAFDSLAGQRLLVLEPGDKSRICMAPPFSAIETPMLVQAAGKSYYANCSRDAFGVAAALQQDADVIANCAHSGELLAIRVRDGQVEPVDCIAHFAVPAALWRQDIIYS